MGAVGKSMLLFHTSIVVKVVRIVGLSLITLGVLPTGGRDLARPETHLPCACARKHGNACDLAKVTRTEVTF